MDITKQQRLVVDALEDVKAQDIHVYNTMHITSLFDRVIIASATSNRQTRALASSVAEKVKGACLQVIAIEGEETGEWVLVDVGDIVVHIMQPAIRAYYNLEEVWGGKPVRMKLLPESNKGVMMPFSEDDSESDSGQEPSSLQVPPTGRRAASRVSKTPSR